MRQGYTKAAEKIMMRTMVQITMMMMDNLPGEAENSSLSKSSSQFLRTRVSASRKTAFVN